MLQLQNMPYISIVVPVLNGEKHINQCINSLLNVDYPKNKFEIIFVDNGSFDKTISIIEQYPVKLLNEKIKSPYVARNRGASHARGEILAFTDANGEVDKNWLKSISHIINSNVDASQGPGYLSKQKNFLARAESKRLFMDKNNFWGDGINFAIKKDVFDKINGFFEFYTGSDSLLLIQLKSLNYNVAYNKNQLVYRKYPVKLTVLIKKNWKYGKGDIIIDAFTNDLRRYRKLKTLITLNGKLFSMLIKSKKSEDLFTNFYYYFISEVRNISYFLNYSLVLEEFNRLICKKSE
ncbi:glycosyltransferase [Candidatus Pacearchaeota archaeon]|nr:glycosyltransferase [Candidatus Pacearchaeota archaeon]